MRKTRRQCWERDAALFLLIESPQDHGRGGRGGGGASEGGVRRLVRSTLAIKPVSERPHVVHAVGSVVNLLQEVFQLLDEDALFEPWKRKEGKEHVFFFHIQLRWVGGRSLITAH